MKKLRSILVVSVLILCFIGEISSLPINKKPINCENRPTRSRQKINRPVLKTVKKVKVSFYAKKFEGRETASGEIYNSQRLTAAHKTWPLGSVVKVFLNHSVVKVTINDRGPFVRNRSLDLSKEAFKKLADLGTGVLVVDSVQLVSVPQDNKF